MRQMRWLLLVLLIVGCGSSQEEAERVAADTATPSVTATAARPVPSTRLVRAVEASCAGDPCEAEEAAAFVSKLIEQTCGEQQVIPCDERHVLVPAARKLPECRTDCTCPKLAEALLDRSIGVLGDLEERYGTPTACDEFAPDCEGNAQAGMLAPPAFHRYCS